MSKPRKENPVAVVSREPGTGRPHTRRAPLAAAMMLALSLDAGLVLAREAPVGVRPEALQYLSGRPLPADMSWEHKVQLDALAAHYGLPSPVPAEGRATIPVTNCNNSGAGSLRNALAVAASGDIINATSLTCSSITLSSGALVINQANLSIRGPGRDQLTVRPGAKYGRVIRHMGTGSLTITGLTLAEGRVAPHADESGTRGGCLFSNGSVTLGNAGAPDDDRLGVRVRGCLAVSTASGVSAQGGGVFAARNLNVYASVISGNIAQAREQADHASGGGLVAGATGAREFALNVKYSEIRDNDALGTSGNAAGLATEGGINHVNIHNTTIAGNAADGKGGAAYLHANFNGSINITNSTVSGNEAFRGAGLLINTAMSPQGRGTTTVKSSTFTGNRNADGFDGAGLSVLGNLELQSTIISGNRSPNLAADVRHEAGSLSGANNLVGDGPAPPSGLIRSDNPGLNALDDYGGPTRTHALLGGSAAIDAGNTSVGNSNDQRGPGFPRVRGVRADIGAYERDPDIIFQHGFQ